MEVEARFCSSSTLFNGDRGRCDRRRAAPPAKGKGPLGRAFGSEGNREMEVRDAFSDQVYPMYLETPLLLLRGKLCIEVRSATMGSAVKDAGRRRWILLARESD